MNPKPKKKERTKKFENNSSVSGMSDSRIKNTSKESSKKNNIKFQNISINPQSNKLSQSPKDLNNIGTSQVSSAFKRKIERIDELRKEIEKNEQELQKKRREYEEKQKEIEEKKKL